MLKRTSLFTTEEKLFAKHGYPEMAAHKQKHDDFIDKVSDFKENFNAGKATLTIDVFSFLNDWLIKHILGTDQQYAVFLNARGVH